MAKRTKIDSAYGKGDPNSYGWGIPNTQLAAQYAWWSGKRWSRMPSG